jgi:hypothetical protein
VRVTLEVPNRLLVPARIRRGEPLCGARVVCAEAREDHDPGGEEEAGETPRAAREDVIQRSER